jgi:hypothetical protein
MNPRAAGVVLVALWLVAPAAAAATYYVSTTGSDTIGNGTQAFPYRTVQRAVVRAAAAGDTIRVLPGVYNECVDTLGKAVEIRAQAFDDSGDRDATTLDGTGVCDGSGGTTEGSVVVLDDGAALRGFTVRGGGLSGITAFGSARILSNHVTANESPDFGGGIYFLSTSAQPGTAEGVIEDNEITGNDCLGEGGGIAVDAFWETAGQGRTVRIEGNTILANDADSGGGIAVLTNTTDESSVRVVMSGNTVEDNRALGALGSGFGGGIWARTFGFGDEQIEIRANSVHSNSSTEDGAGISAWVSAISSGAHLITIEQNSVRSNAAGWGGGGMDLYLLAEEMLPGAGARMLVRDNEIEDNGAVGFGGGLQVSVLAVRSDIPTLFMDVRRNRIVSNGTDEAGGGVAAFVSADADPDVGGATAPAFALLRFTNNLVAVNSARTSRADGVGGGLFVYTEAFGEADAIVEINHATVASNLTDTGAGGIEIETFTDFDFVHANEGIAVVALENSVVSENSRFGVGGPPPDPASTDNTFIEVAWNDVFGNAGGNYEARVGDRTGEFGNISVDPELDAEWIPGPCSPTVDAANPAAPFNAEPQPNGGRANQGHTGNTSVAVIRLPDVDGDLRVDGIDVLRIATAFASQFGQPRYYAPADLDEDGIVDGNDLAYVASRFGQTCK